MPRHWYIKTRSGSTGPLTSKQLIRLAAAGKIHPATGIRSDGQTWVKAKRIASLQFPKQAPSDTYRIKTSGGIAGPFSLEKMTQLVQQGRIQREVAISRNGKSWHRAFRFEELPYEKQQEPIATTPTPDPSDRQQRRAAYQRFGIEVRSQSFRLPGQGRVDVRAFQGGDDRPVTTIVTCGLSDHRLPEHNSSISSRRELIFYTERLRSAHLQLLGCLSRAIAGYDQPLGYGQTLANGTPPKPIFRKSQLDHFLFMVPNIPEDFSIANEVSIEEEPMHLMWVLPITSAEERLIEYQSIGAFAGMLDQFGHGLMIDPKRECYVKRSMAGQPAPKTPDPRFLNEPIIA